MPSFTLILNSTNVVAGSNNSSYKYNFIGGGFSIKNGEMAVGSISIPYSFYNITAAYNNNSFSIYFPVSAGTFSLNIILPDGFYTVNDIQNYVEQQCIANGLYLLSGTQYVFYYYMTYNTTYYAVQVIEQVVPLLSQLTALGLTVPPTGQWSGTGLPAVSTTPQLYVYANNNFGTVIGYGSGWFYPSSPQTTNQSFLSNTTPIGSTINSLVVRCSIVKNNVSVPSDILDGFPITSNVSFGSNITYDPSFEKWVDISDGTFSNLSITFNDQNFNNIVARDPNCCITLIIREKRK